MLILYTFLYPLDDSERDLPPTCESLGNGAEFCAFFFSLSELVLGIQTSGLFSRYHF